MEMTVEEKGTNCAVLRASGRLDAVTSPAFEEKLLSCLQTPDEKLAVDLTRVPYVSSAGLRALIRGAKVVQKGKGTLVLFGVADSVRQVFEIAGFLSFFVVVETEKEALEAIQS